jgi:hypothetical protein
MVTRFDEVRFGGDSLAAFSPLKVHATNVPMFWHQLAATLQSIFVSHKQTSILAKMKQADLLAISALLTSGKVRPVIDRYC